MLLGLIRRPHLLLGAGLLLCSQSLANAGLINFETIPNGDSPAEGYAISNQFESTFGVRFSMESGPGPLLAAIGGPETGFLGYNDIPDNPAPSANAGTFFLTDDGVVGAPPSALVIDYVTPVSAASAAILDIDQQEAWQIDARDKDGNIIDTMQLNWLTAGAGNGLASYWLFSHGANDIYSIRISYVGLTQKGIGLAFDNFWTDSINPNTNVSSTPEPGSLALLGTGIVGMLIPAWRKRRQKALGEKVA
jgi:hypothetical protein